HAPSHPPTETPHPAPGAGNRPTCTTGSGMPTHRLRIGPGQLSGRVDPARGVERLKDLHDPLFVLGAVVAGSRWPPVSGVRVSDSRKHHIGSPEERSAVTRPRETFSVEIRRYL